ncbi:MAG TPA: DEAD/DEAH box helicase [Balneolaceae bacterium]|nr:DEAD/DEAH box helicase [Balneolaceae bacterium]
MKFEELTLSPEVLSGLQNANYDEVTELQKAALPIILDSKDALIKAPKGNDKDVSCVIAALQKVIQKEDRDEPSVLILTPDSPEQINELMNSLGSDTGIQSASVEGEQADIHKEIQQSADVLVANPEPLMNTMQEQRRIFRQVDLLVIDGADEMVSRNLTPVINTIAKRIISKYQTVIYTGELNDDVNKLAERYLNDPQTLETDGRGKARLLNKPPEVSDSLSHGYIYVPPRMKISTLMAHLEEIANDRCVIFTASKRGTDRLYRILRKSNYKTTSLHGKLSDEKRAQRFANFTNGDIQFLLVSDISASELDLREVKQVINYDVPNDADEYRFRADLVGIGKTTRLLSLVSKQDRSDINLLENELGQAPKEFALPEKVKQELNKRKSQKKKRSPGKKSKSQNRNNGRGKKPQKKKKELELPRPSFDKLSGGRTGEKDTKTGVIGMLKKIFS